MSLGERVKAKLSHNFYQHITFTYIRSLWFSACSTVKSVPTSSALLSTLFVFSLRLAPAQQVSSTPAPQTTPPSTTSAPERTATTTAAALPRSQCRMVLDIVFVMDSSRSINASDYAKQKNFVKELASILNVGAGSRAAVIIYSDDPELKIRFDDFSNLEDFNDAVDALPFIMRRTRIDKALKMASDVLSDAR